MHFVLRGACAAFLAGWTAACSASAQTSGPAGTAPAQSSAPAEPATPAAKPALPRVHLVATGGTISNRDGGRLTAEELAKSVPGVDEVATLTHEQFANVASSQITLDQWLQLSRRINALFADDRGAGRRGRHQRHRHARRDRVLPPPHVRDSRPVVVVGSMRNPSTLGYEGAANLLEGVRVAAEPSARGKGVLVVLNDEINSARDVTKTDALRLQTFRSRDVRPARRGRSRSRRVLPAAAAAIPRRASSTWRR